MDVWPAQYHTRQSKDTPGVLTIRLLPLRCCSTSYKLRTETLALGILIRCLRAARGPDASSLHGPGKFTSYALSRFHVKARFHTPLRAFSRTHTYTHTRKHVKRTDANTRRLRSTGKKYARNSASVCACTATERGRGFSCTFLKKQQKNKVKKGSWGISEKLRKHQQF